MMDDELGWLGSVAVAAEANISRGLVAMMVCSRTLDFVWWKQGGPILDSKNYRNGELQSPTECMKIVCWY